MFLLGQFLNYIISGHANLFNADNNGDIIFDVLYRFTGMSVNWEAFDPVVPVMKEELRYALTFGLFCNLSGAVFVNRGSEKGRKALQEGLEDAKRMKKSLWIFPEGTRNHTNLMLLPFKKGAFHMAIQAQVGVSEVIINSVYLSFCISVYRVWAIEPFIRVHRNYLEWQLTRCLKY